MNTNRKKEYMKKWREANAEKVKEYETRYTNTRKQYRLKNREKYKQYNHKYRKENAEKLLQYHRQYSKTIGRSKVLKRKYGITLEDYEAMFRQQDGKCDSCQTPQKNFKRKFHVDHDHSTGKIRGLLCVKCNYLAGLYEENPLCITQIKAYLQKHNTIS